MPEAAKSTTAKPRTKPQDHKPKAEKKLPVGTFEHNGKTYTIPPPSEALTRLPGRAMRDALLDGEEGEVRLAFLALEATGVDQETLDVLYDKPVTEMLDIIGPWFRSADLSGATLPES